MFKFDTRDKKPNVYNIAVLSAAAAVIIAVLLKGGSEQAPIYISAVLLVYFLLVIILLLAAFVKQIQYNPYSYNTIYYMGFALFFMMVFAVSVMLLADTVRDPVSYGLTTILLTMHRSSANFIFFTSPFIVAFSAALCVSNISLIRHEGKRLVNLLGIILSVLMVGAAALLIRLDYYVTGSMIEVMIHDLIMQIFFSLYLYFECMLLGSIVAMLIVTRYEPDPDKDFVIILGCGLMKDGTPTPLLRGRVDRALAFYRKQKEKTGKELMFVTSGGQGPDEVISESASMKRYLIEQGIPESQIIEEDKSTDTFENMKFSKEKIWEKDASGKIAFATTNYHVFRSGLYARRVKMRAVGMGAKTRWYFWPNAAVREFVGILTEHRLKQALIFIGIAAIFTILTVLQFQ